jgi:hypothetical protein
MLNNPSDKIERLLHNLIHKVIIPQYPEIDYYILSLWDDNKKEDIYDISNKGSGTRKYMVNYHLKKDMSGGKQKNLVFDTRSLFRMLGPSTKQELLVNVYDPPIGGSKNEISL